MTKTPADTHHGKVITMTGDKLTTTCASGEQHCHTLAKDAKLTCDGEAVKPGDVKAGTQVKVTTHKDDKTIATHVDCSKHTPAATKKA